jgi:methionyl-tRNA formyltransferase
MRKEAILLGSKPASVAALLLLLKQGWTVKEVVASADQAAWLPGPSLHDVARKLGIRTVVKQSQLESTGVDLVISYMCRSLVKKDTLERGRYALNFHAGPLPEFGGWAFYNVAVLEDSPEYGCTCHIMDEGFDTGPLVKVRRFGINPRLETALSLEKKAQTEMILLFREVISAYEASGEIASVQQEAAHMRYLNAEQFKKMKEIPPESSPEEVDRIARAFWYPPYEIAYYRLPNGTKLEVVPDIAKNEVAKDLHRNDLDDLLRAAGIPLTSIK